MTEKDDIITAPATDDNGNTIIVTAFTNMAKFRSKPKYSIRVEISLPYSADSLGFPDAKDAELLETITTNFEKLLKGKNTAVLTGIYTGAGERNWVFYTFNTDISTVSQSRARRAAPAASENHSRKRMPNGPSHDEMLATVTPAED